MSRILRFSALWIPVAVYGGGIYYLSSLPQVAVAGRLPDYLTHPLEFAGLTVLILRALNGGLKRPVPWRLYFLGMGIAIVYAVSDEIHQLRVPRRTASLKDVLSDTLGAVLALGLVEVFQRAGSLRHRPPPLRVELFTRKDCHLCHDAREILGRVSREVAMSVSEVDVDLSPDSARSYGGEIPVIVAEGIKISKLRPDEDAIRRRLLRLASRSR